MHSVFQQQSPLLKLIVVEDGLASNGPHIKVLKSLDMRFIVGTKRAGHTALTARSIWRRCSLT